MKIFKRVTNEKDNVICPVCKSELEEMKHTGFAMGVDNTHAFSLPLDQISIVTKDDHSRTFKTGSFYICNTCCELMFVYEEQDFRRCSDCQHCGDVEYKSGVFGNDKVVSSTGCKWFNIPFGIQHGGIDYSRRYSDLNTFHCEHIDQCLPEHDSSMQCFLCKHYYKESSTRSCIDPIEKCKIYCKHTTFLDKVQRTIGICAEFEADYQKYKEYRMQFDGMLIVPDDAISIAEFDERLKQEDKENA